MVFLPSLAFTQEKEDSKLLNFVNKIFNDTSTSAEPKYIAYPFVGYTPETSWEFGVSNLYVYNAKRNKENRLSEITGLAFITLENQYGVWFDHAIYTDQNKYFSLGKIRLQKFPLLYHGIGSDTPATPVARIDGLSFTLRERFLRKITENFYGGLELEVSNFSSVTVSERTESYIPPAGIDGFSNFGFGIGLVFDERHNILNPRKGMFVESGFIHTNEKLGSTNSFNNFFLDFRYYQPTFKNQIFAYQFYANSVTPFNNSSVPFSQMALMGGESLMRGYYFGRYRDNVLMATQAEYRFLPFPFSKRFGATAFCSLGLVSSRLLNAQLSKVKAAGGLGVRFLLFPGKDIYTRFDVAYTNEGFGYYLFVGEAF
ncbi:MAG: BamA/TamA family outer membrane protein [Fluviicola sp.]